MRNSDVDQNRGSLPKIAVTIGDVAGIGPEIIVKSWRMPELHEICRPIVLGCPQFIRSQALQFAPETAVRELDDSLDFDDRSSVLQCYNPSTVDTSQIRLGAMSPAAAQAAYDYLCHAIELARVGTVDAIVTLPINKKGLQAAGIRYPGHTEILAERTQTTDFGMMLYRRGLAVLHVTLHMALRDVVCHLSVDKIVSHIKLLDEMMPRLVDRTPRIAVAALNPHASDNGVFGDEEERIIKPAVEAARQTGIDVVGPLPADMLFSQAADGTFDAVVAMYHDQGHIALKLLGWKEAVNITVGLPIIRTSVAHGTGYDIAGRGIADTISFIEAVQVAAKLAQTKESKIAAH